MRRDLDGRNEGIAADRVAGQVWGAAQVAGDQILVAVVAGVRSLVWKLGENWVG
jgi:hypothetical protein